MIIQWVAIGVFILVGLWYLKMEHHTQKVKIAVLIIIGVIAYFSMISIFSSDKVDLTSPRGIVNSVYIYFGWIGQTFSNLWDIGTDTVSLVGNAIRVNSSEEGERRR